MLEFGINIKMIEAVKNQMIYTKVYIYKIILLL